MLDQPQAYPSGKVYSSFTEYIFHRDLFRDTFRLFAEELGRDASESQLDWF